MAQFVLQEVISHYIERESKVYVAYLDNKMAFDLLWRNGLLYKLYELGINSKLWRIIRNSFCDTKAHVLYQGKLSRPFNIDQGTGQGKVSSAWYFLVFINSLLEELCLCKKGLIVNELYVPGVLVG